MRISFVASILVFAIVAVAACSSTDSARDAASNDASPQDQLTSQDVASPDEDTSVTDAPAADSTPLDDSSVTQDTAPLQDLLADIDQNPDVPALPDYNVPEMDVPEYDANAVAEKAYSKCDTDADCPYPLTCETGRNNPLYGQCSLKCATNEECPASPFGNSFGCVYGMCVTTCGIHGGQCPEWLECVSQEFCLEPVSTVADKGPGKSCSEAAECIQPAECVEGEATNPYCAPLCQTNEDCLAAAPESFGQCAAAGGFNFCMFYCGMMGQNKPCPGDMKCEVVICR